MDFPKIKKSIKKYAKNEDGKISKQAIITMGAFIGSSVLGGFLNSDDAYAHGNSHTNSINLQILDEAANGQHIHHASY